MIYDLIQQFADLGHSVFRFRPGPGRNLDLPFSFRRRTRQICQWLIRRVSPSFTGVCDLLSPTNIDIRRYARELSDCIRQLEDASKIYVVAHSRGGRIVSHLRVDTRVRGAICFAYPFRHPTSHPEISRTCHLWRIRIPTLIIQGKRDPYGGAEVTDRYRLSRKVSVQIVDADHGFTKIGADSRDDILSRISLFLELPALASVTAKG
ncbi:alpha/beta family hydrolase [Roseibium sp.]|uniref:alpha/beta family hydrolase n=1 Tax=Roseibium sp. TaxID=1936156 RepID=UPI003A9740D0